jgi:hypothetical protein
MHNWYGIETETEFRRSDWQRQAEAEARLAQAAAGRPARRAFHLPRFSIAQWRGWRAPRLPLEAPVARRRPAYHAK